MTNSLVDDCYAIAKSCGALGGKLLGAGQDGYLLLYASPLYQRNIQEELHKKNCKLEPIKFTNSGLTIWTTER